MPTRVQFALLALYPRASAGRGRSGLGRVGGVAGARRRVRGRGGGGGGRAVEVRLLAGGAAQARGAHQLGRGRPLHRLRGRHAQVRVQRDLRATRYKRQEIGET